MNLYDRPRRQRDFDYYTRFYLKRKHPIDPRALKFRKYLNLQRSEMDLLYSMKIDPIIRNPLKKFLKGRLITFKTQQSFWSGHAEYICSHIRDLTREDDKNQIMQSVPEIPIKKKLYNFLKRCKNLESLKVYREKGSPTLLRSIRYLHQLKSLHLVLDGDQMQKNLNMVRDLNCLRYVCIKLKRSYQNSSEQIIPRFCEHLFKLRSLERIELDLQELTNSDGPHIIKLVLQQIGKTAVDFNIRLRITGSTLKTDDIRYILAITDTLVLQYHQNSQVEVRTDSKLEYERARITRQGHRVLHFSFKEAEEADFVPFIEACSSLQTFWIEADRYQTLLFKQFSFPKTLKNLFVATPYLSGKGANKFLSYLIPALQHAETLEKLFFVLMLQDSVEQIDQLKDLKCIRNSTKYDLTVCHVPGFVINQVTENILLPLCSPITTMNSLKSLKLDFEKSLVAPVKCLQKVLNSLPSTLEQFELVISAYDGPDTTFDLYFPFEKLSQLAEFRLDLCNPLSRSAILQFSKEFVKMKDLEVMVVGGSSFADRKFKKQDIMDGLKQMEKIRDLQVFVGGNELVRFKDSAKGIQANWQMKRFRNW